MARKPLTPEADAASTSSSLPEGVTEDTVVVTGDTAVPASGSAPSLHEGVTTETVVVSDDGTASAPELPVGAVVVVTCTVAAGRRRAGRRWPGGVTRVAASELSTEALAELQGDVLLRVTVEAA